MTGTKALLFGILIGGHLPAEAAALIAAEDVPLRMARVDDQRRAAMPDYTYQRRYVLDNARFHQHAEMIVRVTANHQTGKQVEVLSFTGSETVRNRVFQKLLDAERSVANEEVAAKARITPSNYDFQPAGIATEDGHRCYVLQMTPKKKGKFLVEGKVWVNTEDFGIVRVEGRPVEKLSMWIGKTHVIEHYRKIGSHWLPVLHESQADSFVWGASHLRIESYGYRPSASSAAWRELL